MFNKNALVCDGLKIVKIASVLGNNHSMAAVDILILISSLSMFGLPGIVSYAIQVMNWTPPAISEKINYYSILKILKESHARPKNAKCRSSFYKYT